ncbi:MAG TPA: hypothetical protein VHK03_13980, partial [Aestuariivirgaceae bacterium]|nr:hypothetical protein [Aestuariivirgaceae bacterium]
VRVVRFRTGRPGSSASRSHGSAIDLICDRLKGGWFQNGQKIFGSSIEVTDESGVSLLTFPFTEIISRG